MLLYYISDRKAFTGTNAQQCKALLRRITDCAHAGVDYIQLREKDLSARGVERLARDAVQAVRDNSAATKLLINTRTDVGLAVGADGVHLPAGELSASDVRALWLRCNGQEPLVGVSAHTVADICRAHAEAANFAVLAPIFEKVQAGMTGIGVAALRAAFADLQLPANIAVFALGGVTLFNAQSCIQAGASGVAGIRLFQQGDVRETVQRLRQL